MVDCTHSVTTGRQDRAVRFCRTLGCALLPHALTMFESQDPDGYCEPSPSIPPPANPGPRKPGRPKESDRIAREQALRQSDPQLVAEDKFKRFRDEGWRVTCRLTFENKRFPGAAVEFETEDLSPANTALVTFDPNVLQYQRDELYTKLRSAATTQRYTAVIQEEERKKKAQADRAALVLGGSSGAAPSTATTPQPLPPAPVSETWEHIPPSVAVDPEADEDRTTIGSQRSDEAAAAPAPSLLGRIGGLLFHPGKTDDKGEGKKRATSSGNQKPKKRQRR